MLLTALAYGQIVIGLPILAAYLLWYIPNYLVEKIWSIENVSEYYYMAKTAIEGFLSVMVAYCFFDVVHVKITLWIPIALTVISSLWKLTQNEGFMIFFVNIGIAAGYKLFPYIQAAMSDW